MFNTQKKFWLENPLAITSDFRVLPLDNTCLSEQMNCITRLVIIISIILFMILGFKESLLFLLFSLLLIIILYYIQRNKMTTTVENYKQFYSGKNEYQRQNTTYQSLNQSLVGGPNPKTLIKPIIATPIYDMERQASSLNVPTGVNKRAAQFLGDSGYYIKGCVEQQKDIIEKYEPVGQKKWTMDSSTYPYSKFGKPYVDVNTACTYNPNNSDFGVPDNVAITPCDLKNKSYNENIYTQYLQPNVFTRSEVVGFPSSNIGISFQEPQYPTVVEKTKYGDIYVEKNPKTFKEDNIIEPDPYSDYPTQDEIYDPRQTGYGSQKRSYIEPLTGQPRYMYKDIDAGRRGNFFIRSNIDHLPFAQQSGIMPDDINTNIYRATDQAYIDQNSQFRTDLQQKLMSKRNQEMWQVKKYPMRRDQGGCRNVR